MPTDAADDLVGAIQAGDESAAADFVQRFRPRIETIARKRKVRADDLPDVVQEVLADAIRQIQQGRFRRDAALSTWLYTIIQGKIANYWRDKCGPEVVSLDSVGHYERSLISHDSRERVLWVQEALGRLASTDRFLLILYEQQQYTLEEIGRMIGLRKSAVAARLERAREQFRIAIRDGGKTGGPKRLKK